MKSYGKEIILDLHDCDNSTFTRKSIKRFFNELCTLIEMERCKLSWWDDYGVSLEERETKPHLKGTTAIQFIRTSNITIHTLDLLKTVYLNVFSCKDFDTDTVQTFSETWFKGRIVGVHVVERR